MTMFQGFKTKKEAKAFIRKQGKGYLTWEERTPIRKQLTWRGKDYMMAVEFGGLNQKEYPFAVQWNDFQW